MVSKRQVAKQQAARVARRSTVAAIVLALLFSFVALRDLNGLLNGMRPGSGAPAYAAGDLVVLFAPPWTSDEHAEKVLEGWRSYAAAAHTRLGRETASAKRVLGFFLVVDAFVFVPAYGLGLLLFLWRFRVTPRGGNAPDSRRRTAAIALGALALLVIADELENLATWQLIRDGWPDGKVGSWATLLWLFSVLKWSAAVIVLVPTAFLAHGRFRAWRRRADDKLAAVRRLRIHVALVVFFALLLLIHEQMPDLLRRWTIIQLGWSIAATIALAAGLWFTASRLVVLGPRPATRITNDWASFIAVFAFFGIAFAFWAVDHWTHHDVGWGLLIPAVFFAVVALFSLLYRTPRRRARAAHSTKPLSHEVENDRASSKTADHLRSVATDLQSNQTANRLVRLLPAAVLVVLGLAVVRASFAYAVLYRFWDMTLVLPVLGAVGGGALVGWLLVAGREGSQWWREPLLWATAGGLAVFIVLRLTQGPDELDASLLATVGLLLGCAGWSLYHTLGGYEGYGARLFWIGLSVVGALALALWIAVVLSPWASAAELGGVAIIAGFLAAMSLLGWVLVWLNDGVPPPPALRALELRRIPLLSVIVVWFVLASIFDPGGFHDIRTTAGSRLDTGVRLDDAWRCWLEKNGLKHDGASAGCEEVREPDSDGKVTPLVLVATTGGGIRAAYWTTIALDCAFEVDAPTATLNYPCPTERRTSNKRRSNAIFAGSGISGGSLGLGAYAAYLTEKSSATDESWMKERLDADSLSASVAWWLFVEGPQSLLRFHNRTDRAEVLERGWERDWAGSKGVEEDRGLAQGFLGLWRTHPEVPLLLLNGTSVADGCRFNTSSLDGSIEAQVGSNPRQLERCRSTETFDEPISGDSTDLSRLHPRPRSVLAGTRDLVDFLCHGQAETDVPLSTAALLSGRFPFVSPSGRIQKRCGEDRPVSYVVDGGYFDTSGASPLIEVAQRLLPTITTYNRSNPERRCIVPFLIQIDNGADAGSTNLSKRPLELNAPLHTLFQTRHARAANARTAAALLFSFQFGRATYTTEDGAKLPLRDRYAHFVNLTHPGPQPPLGWTLSEFSRTDLRDQIGQPENVAALAEIREWFSAAAEGRIVCA